jgi:hypothetical protein
MAMAALLLAATPLMAQTAKEHPMHHAKGTFEVKMAPLPTAADDKSGIMHMSIHKQFHGGIEGQSVGEMMSMGNPSKGSAGYVAMERVTGTVDGKSGSFGMQHNGTLDNGAQTLSILVVPGSGTGELAGISGVFHLVIEGGKHSYDLEYSLPDAK